MGGKKKLKERKYNNLAEESEAIWSSTGRVHLAAEYLVNTEENTQNGLGLLIFP